MTILAITWYKGIGYGQRESIEIFTVDSVRGCSWMSAEVLQNHDVATANRVVTILQYTDVTVISNWHLPALSTLHYCVRCCYLTMTFIWLHTPYMFTIWLQRRKGWFILIGHSEYLISCCRGTWCSCLRMPSHGFCYLIDLMDHTWNSRDNIWCDSGCCPQSLWDQDLCITVWGTGALSRYAGGEVIPYRGILLWQQWHKYPLHHLHSTA